MLLRINAGNNDLL